MMNRALITAAVVSLGAGAATGQFLEPDVQVLHTLQGEANGDFFGYFAQPVPDLDGDGVGELFVGAPYQSFSGGNSGRAYLISGATGVEIRRFIGSAGDYLGTAVGDAGDVNNDGVSDQIVGGPGGVFLTSPTVPGKARVYSGADGSLIWEQTGETIGDKFGGAVAGLFDDVNDDGFNDVLVTAQGWDLPYLNAGRLYILSGLDGSTLMTLNGVAPSDAFGSAVDSIEDLDGDGLRDIIVAGHNAGPGNQGEVLVVSSVDGSTIWTLHPDANGLCFGQFFASAGGDVDNDGVEDIYVPDFCDTTLGTSTGKAYVFSGATGLKIRDWIGVAAGEGFGIGRGVGDADHDGYDDLWLASWISDESGVTNSGKGYLLSGRDSGILFEASSTILNGEMGFDALGVGDVDGDGWLDYVLTGAGATDTAAANSRGAVFVIRGPAFPCSDADLTTLGAASGDPGYGVPDGKITASDIGYFVNAWVAQDTDVADLTTQGAGAGDPGYGVPDGVVSASDIEFYVNLWVAGCP